MDADTSVVKQKREWYSMAGEEENGRWNTKIIIIIIIIIKS